MADIAPAISAATGQVTPLETVECLDARSILQVHWNTWQLGAAKVSGTPLLWLPSTGSDFLPLAPTLSRSSSHMPMVTRQNSSPSSLIQAPEHL